MVGGGGGANMVEQNVSPGGGHDPDDPNPDRYDLISDDLEQYILDHSRCVFSPFDGSPSFVSARHSRIT